MLRGDLSLIGAARVSKRLPNAFVNFSNGIPSSGQGAGEEQGSGANHLFPKL